MGRWCLRSFQACFNTRRRDLLDILLRDSWKGCGACGGSMSASRGGACIVGVCLGCGMFATFASCCGGPDGACRPGTWLPGISQFNAESGMFGMLPMACRRAFRASSGSSTAGHGLGVFAAAIAAAHGAGGACVTTRAAGAGAATAGTAAGACITCRGGGTCAGEGCCGERAVRATSWDIGGWA